MFSIFKSSVKFPIAEFMQVDVHSHILPGIDDGAPDLEVSLRLIKGLKSLGFKRLTASPHVYLGVHPNTDETITRAYQMLKEGLLKEDVAIEIACAAEYMIDEHFDVLLEQKSLRCLADQHVLVEVPFLSEPVNLIHTLFRTKAAGYQPVLAHPERYHFMFNKLAKAEDLKNRGVFLQLNALSLIGYYGKREKTTALALLEAGLVDFIGTDLHHDRHLAALANYMVDRKTLHLLEKAKIKNTQFNNNSDF